MRLRLGPVRLSDSIGAGPFRLRVSVPLSRSRGRVWAGVSVRTVLGRVGVSAPVERTRK
jgi:hypothetical protein